MRYVIAIVGLVVLLGSLAGIKAGQISSLIQAGKAMEKAGPPPEIVSAAPAETTSAMVVDLSISRPLALQPAFRGGLPVETTW